MALTKSSFIRGYQCPKMLWMDANLPEAADNLIINEDFAAMGNTVGDLAKGYFGKFVEVPFSHNKKKMHTKTMDLMEAGITNICQASFSWNGNFCNVDILRCFEDHVDIVEVKSSIKVSDVFLYDMAYQYLILTQCGLKVEHVYNLHLNKDYVRKGKLSIKKLFELTDCTEEVIKRRQFVKEKIREINKTVKSQEEPEVELSESCSMPYDCVYWNYCSRKLPKPNLFDVHGMQKNKQFDLYRDGVISFQQLAEAPAGVSESQLQQVLFELENRPPYVDKKAIGEFLNTLSYPLYYLDFEAYNPPIPEFDGVSPYMQVPFQYSLHVQKTEGGPLEHYEFLGKEGEDPRRALAEHLVADIPKDVCLLAYNNTFEESVISKLAGQFPDLSEHLMNIHGGIKDLMVPFRNHSYYCKAMNGSYSIKYVLPAMCPDDPELDYHRLDGVHNGAEASATFRDMCGFSEEEVIKSRENLLKYCGLDTYAMVKIVEKLYKLVK
ncbi:MAG: DUF2779 domain-containing protein [Lachnospiraceae bacterium]|nr:DUF2779 domain-containing protein [Lachnospiraceae bacterium]